MNEPEKQDAKKKAEVMIAFSNGEIIEKNVKNGSSESWKESHSPDWNWCHYTFRIKP